MIHVFPPSDNALLTTKEPFNAREVWLSEHCLDAANSEQEKMSKSIRNVSVRSRVLV